MIINSIIMTVMFRRAVSKAKKWGYTHVFTTWIWPLSVRWSILALMVERVKNIYIIHFLLFWKSAWKKYPTLSGHRVFGVPSGLVGDGNGAGQPAGTPQEGSNFVVCRRCCWHLVRYVACTWSKKSPLNREKSGVKVFPCG